MCLSLRLHLKLFLKKASLSQLLFDRLIDDYTGDKYYVNDGNDNNNSAIKPSSELPDNRTIGLVTTDDNNHTNNGSECRTLTIYGNNNKKAITITNLETMLIIIPTTTTIIVSSRMIIIVVSPPEAVKVSLQPITILSTVLQLGAVQLTLL